MHGRISQNDTFQQTVILCASAMALLSMIKQLGKYPLELLRRSKSDAMFWFAVLIRRLVFCLKLRVAAFAVTR